MKDFLIFDNKKRVVIDLDEIAAYREATGEYKKTPHTVIVLKNGKEFKVCELFDEVKNLIDEVRKKDVPKKDNRVKIGGVGNKPTPDHPPPPPPPLKSQVRDIEETVNYAELMELSPEMRENREQTIADLETEKLETMKRIAEMEEEIECLEDILISMEMRVIDGYFVRFWKESSDSWIAYCPTVGVVVEMDSREKALEGISEGILAMVLVLAELGGVPPGKDITLPHAETST